MASGGGIMFDTSAVTESPIVERARAHWLDNKDVLELLNNFSAHGLPVQSEPIRHPKSGSLFVFNRAATRNFRQDGVPLIMRADRITSAKESNMRLKVAGKRVINCAYASCQPDSPPDEHGDVAVFRRRVYSKYPKPKGDVQDYVLVHYLREKIQNKAPGVQGRSKHGKNALSKGVPSQGSSWPLTIVEYSPNWDTCRGGAKVLVCVKGDSPQLTALASGTVDVQCQFGAMVVPAQHVAHGVLRCLAPMHTAGIVKFAIIVDQRPVTAYSRFEFRPPAVAHMPAQSFSSERAFPPAVKSQGQAGTFAGFEGAGGGSASAGPRVDPRHPAPFFLDGGLGDTFMDRDTLSPFLAPAHMGSDDEGNMELGSVLSMTPPPYGALPMSPTSSSQPLASTTAHQFAAAPAMVVSHAPAPAPAAAPPASVAAIGSPGVRSGGRPPKPSAGVARGSPMSLVSAATSVLPGGTGLSDRSLNFGIASDDGSSLGLGDSSRSIGLNLGGLSVRSFDLGSSGRSLGLGSNRSLQLQGSNRSLMGVHGSAIDMLRPGPGGLRETEVDRTNGSTRSLGFSAGGSDRSIGTISMDMGDGSNRSLAAAVGDYDGSLGPSVNVFVPAPPPQSALPPPAPPRSPSAVTDACGSGGGSAGSGASSSSPALAGRSPRLDAATVRAARVRHRAEPHRDRETKIRIVERLGRVENNLASSTRGSGEDDGFLDDAALEGMSDEKLQALTEQLLEHVIGQLTQHASQEETLMQELITSDVNGMTMLHYTCMYNYPRLVPVLLASGADPNKPTAAGQSPLHLAASHGLTDICDQLVRYSASALLRDKQGLTPYQRAYRNGHAALGAKLQAMALSEARINRVPIDTVDGWQGTPARAGSDSGAGSAAHAVSAGMHRGHAAPRAQSTSPATHSSDSDRKSDAGGDVEEASTRKLLLNAFSSMTLHDKCAISLVMGRDKDSSMGQDEAEGDLFGGVAGLRDTDVASVISENDASLVQAMSLMSDEEQLSLEADARRIQTNVRSWLLRRNYRSMRDAARKLQAATRGMLARKNFEVHKHKAFAALVIQRATRSWLKSFVDASVGAGSAVAPVRRPSLHTVREDRRE